MTSIGTQCATCHVLPGLLICSKCRQRVYCSKLCQVKDWKAGHKQACNSTPLSESDASALRNELETSVSKFSIDEAKESMKVAQALVDDLQHKFGNEIQSVTTPNRDVALEYPAAIMGDRFPQSMRSSRVLVLGCGDGSLPISMVRDGFTNVVAVDVDELKGEKLEEAAAAAGIESGLEVYVMPADQMTFGANAFSGVVDNGILARCLATSTLGPKDPAVRPLWEALRVLKVDAPLLMSNTAGMATMKIAVAFGVDESAIKRLPATMDLGGWSGAFYVIKPKDWRPSKAKEMLAAAASHNGALPLNGSASKLNGYGKREQEMNAESLKRAKIEQEEAIKSQAMAAAKVKQAADDYDAALKAKASAGAIADKAASNLAATPVIDWTQSLSEVEITITFSRVVKLPELSVNIAPKHLSVTLLASHFMRVPDAGKEGDKTVVDGELFSPIITADSSFALEDGIKVVIDLQKKKEGNWPTLFEEPVPAVPVAVEPAADATDTPPSQVPESAWMRVSSSAGHVVHIAYELWQGVSTDRDFVAAFPVKSNPDVVGGTIVSDDLERGYDCMEYLKDADVGQIKGEVVLNLPADAAPGQEYVIRYVASVPALGVLDLGNVRHVVPGIGEDDQEMDLFTDAAVVYETAVHAVLEKQVNIGVYQLYIAVPKDWTVTSSRVFSDAEKCCSVTISCQDTEGAGRDLLKNFLIEEAFDPSTATVVVHSDCVAIRLPFESLLPGSVAAIEAESMSTSSSTGGRDASIQVASLRCRYCGAQFTRAGALSRTLPLPSGRFDDIIDEMVCFEGATAVPMTAREVTYARRGTCLVGETFVLVHMHDIEDDTLAGASQGDSLRCARCETPVGTVAASDSIGKTTEHAPGRLGAVLLKHRLLGEAIESNGNDKTNSKDVDMAVDVPLADYGPERWLVQEIASIVETDRCHRFVIYVENWQGRPKLRLRVVNLHCRATFDVETTAPLPAIKVVYAEEYDQHQPADGSQEQQESESLESEAEGPQYQSFAVSPEEYESIKQVLETAAAAIPLSCSVGIKNDWRLSYLFH